MPKDEGLKIISLREFDEGEELYHVVDFLNKSLKEKNIIFGIRKNGAKSIITIYET